MIEAKCSSNAMGPCICFMGRDWEFILNLQIFKGHRVGWWGVGELISDNRLLPKGLHVKKASWFSV